MRDSASIWMVIFAGKRMKGYQIRTGISFGFQVEKMEFFHQMVVDVQNDELLANKRRILLRGEMTQKWLKHVNAAIIIQEKEPIERDNALLNEELTAKVDSLVELRRTNADLEADMSAELSNEKEPIERDNALLNEELTAKVDSLVELRRTNADLEADMSAELSNEKEPIERDNALLNEELTAKVDSLVELRRTNADLEADMSAELSNEKEPIERDNALLNEELTAKVDSLVELRRTNADLEADMSAELSNEKEPIERDNALLNEELTAKVDSLVELRRTNADLEADMSAELSNEEGFVQWNVNNCPVFDDLDAYNGIREELLEMIDEDDDLDAYNGIREELLKMIDEEDGPSGFQENKYETENLIMQRTLSSLEEKYIKMEEVGAGTYGSVSKAFDKQSCEYVAIKKLKAKYSSLNECNKLREVKCLMKMNHPNVVKLKEVVMVNDSAHFVFEYMDYDLHHLMEELKKQRRRFSADFIKYASFQMLQGLHHMHRHGYFHRDLKPENVLLLKTNEVKIADLGMTREINTTPRRTPYTSGVTTLWYRAPEVLLDSQYGPKIDMWAMGAIMAEMFIFSPLFPGTSEASQMHKICAILGSPTKESWADGLLQANKIRYTFPEFISAADLSYLMPSASADAISLITLLCSWDPSRRPTPAEALQHQFFQNNFNVPPSIPLREALRSRL